MSLVRHHSHLQLECLIKIVDTFVSQFLATGKLYSCNGKSLMQIKETLYKNPIAQAPTKISDV